jgi:amidohydrolase
MAFKEFLTMSPEQLREDAQRAAPAALRHREHLHRHPEPSFQEHQTMAYVAAVLTELGVRHETGVGGTGVVAYFPSPHSDRWIGLRSELDALPIHEGTEAPYQSTIPGWMHACGHDAHTAILLGVAEVLAQRTSELPSSVKLIFQPGEEQSPGGANLIIDAGVLQEPPLDFMVALHVYPELPVGNFGIRSGLYMASSDEIHLEIHGKGGHGALPHLCINPLNMAAEIILHTQLLIDQFQPEDVPTVLSFGRIEALGATNVIPSTCILKGTFRTLNEPWRAEFFKRFEDSLRKIEHRYGGEIKLQRNSGYPFLYNDPSLTVQVKEALVSQFGKEVVHDLDYRMTAEDFAFYSHKIPVSFFRLGVGDPAKATNYSVHHPKFDIHPGAVQMGIEAMLAVVFHP